MAKNEGIISIHGKDYATVAYRLELFRANCPAGLITTELVKDEDGVIIMKAFVYDEDSNLLASDYAEEVRGSSNINKTSALENCSTSAVGRALALAGYNKSGAGVASADEVTVAIARQQTKVMDKKITEKQRNTIEGFLDDHTDGDLKLERLCEWGEVDNLSKLSEKKADQWIKKNITLDIMA